MSRCCFQVLFKRIILIVMHVLKKKILCFHIFIRKLTISGHLPFYGSNVTAIQEEIHSVTLHGFVEQSGLVF